MGKKIFVLLWLSLAAFISTSQAMIPAQGDRAVTRFFERNVAQGQGLPVYVARGANYNIQFFPGKITFHLHSPNAPKSFSMNLPRVVNPEGKGHQAKLFYYSGHATKKSTSTHSEIIYRDIAKGVDLRFYFNGGFVEYDFIVRPKADYSGIRFEIAGPEEVTRESDGRLGLRWGSDTLFIKAPFSFQEKNKQRKEIASSFVLTDNRTVGFQLAQYDSSKILVIDPIIDFLTYWGGTGDEAAKVLKMAPDGSGDYYVTGTTVTYENLNTLKQNIADSVETTSNFLASPLTPHAINQCATGSLDYRATAGVVADYDAFIARFNASHQLVFASYMGGCGNDAVKDMELRLNGAVTEIYVTGFTLSPDFPKLNAHQQRLSPDGNPDAPDADAFVSKMDENGVLLFSTYLGGDGKDGGRAISVDASNRIYVLGYSHSRNWLDAGPCTEGGVTGVIQCKHSLVNEAIDPDNPYNTSTADAFLARIGSTGVLNYVTYLGGVEDDWGSDIVVATEGAAEKIIAVFNTASAGFFPDSVTPSFRAYRQKKDDNGNEQKCSRFIPFQTIDAHICEDVALARISLDGKTIETGTFFGGDEDDNVTNVEVDADGGIVFSGVSLSPGLKVDSAGEIDTTGYQVKEGETLITDPETLLEFALARFPRHNSIDDAIDDTVESNRSLEVYVTKLDSTMTTMVYSSFVRGKGREAVSDMVVNNGKVYLAGHTQSPDFPNSGGYNVVPINGDAYIAALSTDGLGKLKIDYSALLGAESVDYIDAIDLDASDRIHFIGGTRSLFLPGVNATDSTLEKYTIGDQSYTTDLILGQLDMLTASENTNLEVSYTSSTTENIVRGKSVSFTINVVNNGLQTNSDVRLFIDLPPSVFKEGVLVSDYNCYRLFSSKANGYGSLFTSYATSGDAEMGALYCLLGDVFSGSGNSKSLSFSMRTASSGKIAVEFSASGQSFDIDQSNNRQIHTVKVVDPVKQSAVSPCFIVILCLLTLLSVGLRRRYN